MVHVFLMLQNGRSIFSGWNNCTPQSSSAVRASRPQAKPALALAHHKTGTFFALAVGSVFCRGRCCVRLMNPGDAVWPLRSVAQPELVLSVFGHGVRLGPSDVQNFRRIVHFVRSPQQVVTSAVRYHAAGHENFRLLLTLEVAPNGSTWSVVAGKQGTVYCASETSSPDVVRLIRTGVGLLKRSSTVKHAGLLRSLHAKQQLRFEAAWNWCELSNMLRIAESLCAHAHAVQLDVSRSSGRSGAAGSGLALNLTGLARQLTPPGQSHSWVAEARTILQTSSQLSSHASSSSSSSSTRSAFAGQDRQLASVYARLEARYSALRGCTSWREWSDDTRDRGRRGLVARARLAKG